VGDLPKPKLAFFFDEAHLLFDGASNALMEQVERTVRLIRSKGVGVFFVTQAPTDVPSSVLAQLGNRIQHALRAFTPEDVDALRKTARTFPVTEFYDVERTITSLGIGEALVTVLSPRGIPTPLAATRLLPPDSRMAALDPADLQGRIAVSALHAKYGQTVDPQSAHEIITGRIAAAKAAADEAARQAGVQPVDGTGMTIAQQQREIARQAREQAQAEVRAQREADRDARAARRDAAAAARQRERMVETGVRTAGRVLGSRTGQSILRGVFGTLFGGGRSR
jgi:uncharacterized protein